MKGWVYRVYSEGGGCIVEGWVYSEGVYGEVISLQSTHKTLVH